MTATNQTGWRFLLALAVLMGARTATAAGEEWLVLFDGKSIDDWMLNTPGPSRPKADMAEGAIRLTGGEGYLALPWVFENFDLQFRARLSDPAGNARARLLFRCEKHDRGRYPNAYHLLIEPGSTESPTGTIQAIAASRRRRFNERVGLAKRIPLKEGEWFKIRLVVNDYRFTVSINDQQILDVPDKNRRLDRGHILLDHTAPDTVAEFRDIRLKELPSASKPVEPRPGALDFTVPPLRKLDGFEVAFDGKTLAGWRRLHSVHGTAGGWQVINGALCGTQKLPNDGGLLATEQPHGDFELSIDLRPDFGIDSGILLRGDDKGRGYQVLVDYNGGNVSGLYGEEIGAFYRPARGFRQVWKKDGWNNIRARIVGNPPHITTWLNGVRQIDWQDNRRRLPDKGRIVLQVHGGPRWPRGIFVRYANVQIKRLGK